MCLCGMLAAEDDTLPEPMRRAVIAFFDASETWHAGVLEAGRDGSSLRFDGDARDAARTIVSGLHGAMLVARSYGDPRRFQDTAERLLAGFAAG